RLSAQGSHAIHPASLSSAARTREHSTRRLLLRRSHRALHGPCQARHFFPAHRRESFSLCEQSADFEREPKPRNVARKNLSRRGYEGNQSERLESAGAQGRGSACFHSSKSRPRRCPPETPHRRRWHAQRSRMGKTLPGSAYIPFRQLECGPT